MKKQVHVVGAIILNEEKEVFCAQRGAQMTLANKWEFPGGKIEQGETKKQALIREIKEELSCEIEVYEQVEDTTYEYETFIVRLETYIAKIINGTPIISEHAASLWLPINKLQTIEWAAADIPAVEKLQMEFK